MFDLVVRGGSVIDGTGVDAVTADVAISDGRIVEVGRIDAARGRQVIDADGLLVTPGFVDIHTHYDGQATWDPYLTPSSWHGVTTVMMGNCGVGFAPAAPDRHEWLIGLMEGVEDIPGAALSEGIEWGWESFPEYLDVLASKSLAIDVATQVPHGPIRAYVMGERGASNEPATTDDIAAMSALVEEGLRAGAFGFSTSRTIMHTAINGEPVPGTFAAEDELFGLGEALRRVGHGVFELAPAGALGEDLLAADREMNWMRRLAKHIARPVSFALNQNSADRDEWRRLLDASAAAVADGAAVYPQVHAHAVTLLTGLGTFHPFEYCPSWSTLVPAGPANARAATMRTTEVREQLLREIAALDSAFVAFMSPRRLYSVDDPPEYEPDPSTTLGKVAAAAGAEPWAFLYDLLSSGEGDQLVMAPIHNYADGDLSPSFEMLSAPHTVFGLGDGGSHCGQTCDASSTTFLLTHWARDRSRGPRLRLEDAVAKMTSKTAAVYGLVDRGVLAPGRVADLNLIDLARLELRRPEVVHDLPARGRRLIQRADGYVATVKTGEVIYAEGKATGALPGSLLRS